MIVQKRRLQEDFPHVPIPINCTKHPQTKHDRLNPNDHFAPDAVSKLKRRHENIDPTLAFSRPAPKGRGDFCSLPLKFFVFAAETSTSAETCPPHSVSANPTHDGEKLIVHSNNSKWNYLEYLHCCEQSPRTGM